MVTNFHMILIFSASLVIFFYGNRMSCLNVVGVLTSLSQFVEITFQLKVFTGGS